MLGIDLFGTLIDEPGGETCLSALQKVGIEPPQHAIAIRSVQNGFLLAAAMDGADHATLRSAMLWSLTAAGTPEEVGDIFLRRFATKSHVDVSQLIEAYNILCDGLIVRQDILNCLQRAKNSGRTLILVTDMSVFWRTAVNNKDIAPYFDTTIISCDLQHRKMDGVAWGMAIRERNIDPIHAALIGDSWWSDAVCVWRGGGRAAIIEPGGPSIIQRLLLNAAPFLESDDGEIKPIDGADAVFEAFKLPGQRLIDILEVSSSGRLVVAGAERLRSVQSFCAALNWLL